MLLDLRFLWEQATPAVQGTGGTQRDVTPEQLARIRRRAAELRPILPPYLHPRTQPALAPALPDWAAIVLYELGEVDEPELIALLAR